MASELDSDEDFVNAEEITASVVVGSTSEQSCIDEEEVQKCPLCVYTAASKVEIGLHLRGEHFDNENVENVSKESSLVYSCDKCNFMDSSVENLKRHKLTEHLGFNYHCSMCSYVAAAPSDLSGHTRRVHRSKKPYHCGRCDISYSSSANLQSHSIRIHHDNVFRCKHCKFVTESKQRLDQHTTDEHCYSCDDCDHFFNKLLDLKMHIKRRHGTKEFSCDMCDHVAISTAHLNHHRLSEHKYKCEMCTFSASRLSLLRQHKFSVHSNCENCDICRYIGEHRLDLELHKIDVHHQEKFSCSECSFFSTRKSNVRTHMKEKHWSISYLCEYCLFVGDTEEMVQKHIQDQHIAS